MSGLHCNYRSRGMVCLFLFGAFSLIGFTAAEAAVRPHIVYFMTDDQGWADVGYHGAEFPTPTMDKMAKDGVELENFYAQPVCAPTRGCMLTGRYAHRIGLQDGVIKPWNPAGLDLGERTLADALKEAGYHTAIFGKWHLGFSRKEYMPNARGFDHQYGILCGALDHVTKLRDGAYDWRRNGKTVHEEGHITDLIRDEALRFIQENDDETPMFLYVAFTAPHVPFNALPEDLEKLSYIKGMRRNYAAMITQVDRAMQEIMDAMTARGWADNTLYIYHSDNGGVTTLAANNGPLKGAKKSVWDGGVRVPAALYWPGVLPKGKVIRDPLHVVDMYPTLINLAGGSLVQERPVDGCDLWPVIMDGEQRGGGKPIFWAGTKKQMQAIRRGPWKLVLSGNQPFLSHLENDPGEKQNLAKQYPEITTELMTLLEAEIHAGIKPLTDGSFEPWPKKGGPTLIGPESFPAL